MALALAIGRDGVGLELSGEVDFGLAQLSDTRARLIGVGFPLDVTGGVERFRHRRTDLDRATVRLPLHPLERWLSHFCLDQVGPGPVEARVSWRQPPALSEHEREEQVVWAADNVRVEIASLGGPTVLAFDVALGAQGAGLVAHAHRLRAVSTPNAPTQLVGTLWRRLAQHLGGKAHGLRLTLPDPLRGALRAAFSARGARVPGRTLVCLTEVAPREDVLQLRFGRDRPAHAPSPLLIALEELERLTGQADEAWVAGDTMEAREGYVRALERAPGHRTILGRLAELDAYTGDRTEAAASWLREASRPRARRGLDGNDLGRTLLLAELFHRMNAPGRARSAYLRAGAMALDRGESRLSACALGQAATLMADDDPQLGAVLEKVLAADPVARSARWRRLQLALSQGETSRAETDLQHLEALARTSPERLDVFMRAGQAFLDHGFGELAAAVLGRALVVAPESRAVQTALGDALLAAQETTRAIALLRKACRLEGTNSKDEEQLRTNALLHLATALAERLGDVSGAIARLREIPAEDPHGALARALEAVYRLRVGDQSGADRVLMSACELIERHTPAADEAKRIRELLSGAARVVAAEQPTLAVRIGLAALTLAPGDQALRTLVRTWGRRTALAESESMHTRPTEPAPEPPLNIANAYAALRAERASNRPWPGEAREPEPAGTSATVLAATAGSMREARAAREAQAADPWPADPRPAETPAPPQATSSAAMPPLVTEPVQATASTAPPLASEHVPEGPTVELEAEIPPITARSDEQAPSNAHLVTWNDDADHGLGADADADALTSGSDDERAAQEARAEVLLAKVKADAADDACIGELIDLLALLGRDFELFALLAARLEDAPADEQARLRPRQRTVLERMADVAESHGRALEAQLYREAAGRLA